MSENKGKPSDPQPSQSHQGQMQNGQNQNEGEGSRSAARHYNEGVKATVESGKVPEKADEARRALDGAEGEDLRRAEKEAKERGTG